MSVSFAVKCGVSAVGVIGTPVTTYFLYNHFSLYEIERKIISGEEQLIVSDSESGESSGNEIAVVKVSTQQSTKWSCSIKAKLESLASSAVTLDQADKTKLKEYIEKRFSSTSSASPQISDEEKKLSRKELVRNCSFKREISKTDDSVTITSSWVVEVKKSENNLTVDMFGKEVTIPESSG